MAAEITTNLTEYGQRTYFCAFPFWDPSLKGHLPSASLGESGGDAIFAFWLKHEQKL